MKALLLSAGLGTRLQPLTNVLPKCLVPINGRPLLEYWLQYLENDISEILVNLHYFSELVTQFIQNSSYSQKVQTVYEPKLLGTGGTLFCNRNFFSNESVMLIHADNLCFCDFRQFIQSHHNRPKGTEITMMTFTTPTPETCGIVELDKTGTVQRLHEKVNSPPGNLANAAVYIIEPSVIDFMKKKKKEVIDFSTEVLPHFMGRINAWHNQAYHRDIGNIDSLTNAQIEFFGPVDVPVESDPWADFCGKANIPQAQQIMLSLASALEANIIPLMPKQPCKILEQVNLFSKETNSTMLVSDHIPIDLENKINCVKSTLAPQEKMFTLFHLAPSGFSTKQLFDITNLPGFIICTSH